MNQIQAYMKQIPQHEETVKKILSSKASPKLASRMLPRSMNQGGYEVARRRGRIELNVTRVVHEEEKCEEAEHRKQYGEIRDTTQSSTRIFESIARYFNRIQSTCP